MGCVPEEAIGPVTGAGVAGTGGVSVADGLMISCDGGVAAEGVAGVAGAGVAGAGVAGFGVAISGLTGGVIGWGGVVASSGAGCTSPGD